MLSSYMSILRDGSQKELLRPHLERASIELAGTCFESMLTTECQTQLLSDLTALLVEYSKDTLSTLATRVLAQKNWLWGMNAALAPKAKELEAREIVATQISTSGAAIVDEAAPLLRSELHRQVTRFVATTLELLERVCQDRHRIATELLDGGIDGEIGLIEKLDMRLGDCHNGGRRTTVVTCEAGRFVYKPRCCLVDLWFANLASKYVPDGLRQPRTISRQNESGDWGFAEFIERTQVQGNDGIARYWHNFGRAAALFQALGSEDLHCENFIASGEFPSLVDSETVITSKPTYFDDSLTFGSIAQASKGFGRDIIGTLASSALLPAIIDVDFNCSPLVVHDRMCLPIWDGSEYDVRGYEDEFLSGFDEALARLAARADELESDVWLANHIPVRRLLRSTQAYGRMLERLRRNDAYTQAKRDELLGALHGPSVGDSKTIESPLITSEAINLAKGDVPYFYAEAGSYRITGSDGTFDDQLLNTTAIDRALWRIHALDETHRSFFHDVMADNINRALLPCEEPIPPCIPSDEALSKEVALEEATEIFCRLERLVITSPSGEASWLFRDSFYAPTSSTVEFGTGLGGMAVFLAALLPRTRSDRIHAHTHRRLLDCLKRIDEAVSALESAHVIHEHLMVFGIADGLGGLLHALDLVVAALDEGSHHPLRKQARDLRERLIRILPRADVEHAAKTDVYTGVSGLLLALGTCPAAAHNKDAAALAQRLANRLLELRCVGEDARLCGTVNAKWPVSGFAHGQAGIAAALAKGVQTFGIDVGGAVLDALTFESDAYNNRIGTWPDLRTKRVSDTYLHGICSGAPGVGLAALMVAESTTSPEEYAVAQHLLKRADKTCAEFPPQERDVICCGNLSPVEYFLSRHKQQEAGRQLAGVVHRKQEFGSYVVYHPKWKQVDDPSFLLGHAGIGYLLLRYADPSLPPVF